MRNHPYYYGPRKHHSGSHWDARYDRRRIIFMLLIGGSLIAGLIYMALMK